MEVDLNNSPSFSLKLWTLAINAIIALLFIILIVSIFVTVKEEWPLKLLFSIEGINNFISIYSTSIKIAAAFITVLTIKVSIVRLNQNEETLKRTNYQLKNYKESENLKNYFLHRKEFRDYIKETSLIKELEKEEAFDFYSLWNTLYKSFYYTSYREFNPKLNGSIVKSMNNFLNEIKKSCINLIQVPSIEEDELSRLITKNITSLRDIISLLVDFKLKAMNSTIFSNKIDKHPNYRILRLMVEIYTTKQLYEYILSFDGLPIIESFTFNENYFQFINIIKTYNYEE